MRNHNHVKINSSRAFIIGIALNSLFIIFEIIFGLQANSLALLADAGHNMIDVVGLMMAWFAVILSNKKSSKNFTYGMQSATIMAALINAILLVLACVGIIYEATQRLVDGEYHEVSSQTVIYVALLGIIVNGVSAWFFAKDKKDLNMRASFLHMTADAAVSLGVVISGIVILKTGTQIIDPLVSLIIAAVILVTSWNLLKNSLKLTMHAVPQEIDSLQVRQYLQNLPEVREVHDLHIWALSTNYNALTAHLAMYNYPAQDFLRKVETHLEKNFDIEHSTIQIEIGEDDSCNLAKEHRH